MPMSSHARAATSQCCQFLQVSFFLLFSIFTAQAIASDYAREARFADEIRAQLVVGEAVMLPVAVAAPASGQPFLGIYTVGKPSMPAIVLAHGVGAHPEDGLTGSLRLRLNDLGYTTLAIQMPVAAKEAVLDNYFPALFPLAGVRLAAASAWLRAKGHKNLVLVGHNMGSWMANTYLDANVNKGDYQAWVCISLTGGYSSGVRNYPIPILDLYGENDIPVTVSSAWRRSGTLRLAAAGSKQVMVGDADAQWRGSEQAAAQAIAQFLSALPL
jgi:pimeloyl-ACP methyl ester carboxylesterase